MTSTHHILTLYRQLSEMKQIRTLSSQIMPENSCTNSNSFYLLESSSGSHSVPTCSYFKHISNIFGNCFPQLQQTHSFNQPFMYLCLNIHNILLIVPSNVISKMFWWVIWFLSPRSYGLEQWFPQKDTERDEGIYIKKLQAFQNIHYSILQILMYPLER